jgi:hypothetical protein
MRSILLLAVICFISTGCERGKPENVSFENDIKPILRRSCIPCHNPAISQGNINLSSYDSLMESRYFTRPAPIAIAGNPSESRLYIVVTTGRDAIRMPPDDSNLRRLPSREAEKIRVWIDEGAKNN